VVNIINRSINSRDSVTWFRSYIWVTIDTLGCKPFRRPCGAGVGCPSPNGVRGIFLMLIIFPIDEFWCILKAHCIMVNVVLSIMQWFGPITPHTFLEGGIGS